MFKLLTITLLLTTASVRADIFNVGDSARGWVCSPSPSCGAPDGFTSNNGALQSNNYFAGFEPGQGQFRDWFEFSIPTLSGGSLASATLELDEPGQGHNGGPLTYAVYGLSGRPLIFTDVTTSNPFGSVGTSSADNGTTVDITLDAAALAAISADQGGNIFIGGIDSGELGSSQADFALSDNCGPPLPPQVPCKTVLSLQTAPVPEPSSYLLFGTVAIGLAYRLRRRRISARSWSRSE